jgi:hypothetical protein
LRRVYTIEAITLLHTQTDLGLREAKDVVESSGILATTSLGGAQLLGSAQGMVICVALALALIYYFLRG